MMICIAKNSLGMMDSFHGMMGFGVNLISNFSWIYKELGLQLMRRRRLAPPLGIVKIFRLLMTTMMMISSNNWIAVQNRWRGWWCCCCSNSFDAPKIFTWRQSLPVRNARAGGVRSSHFGCECLTPMLPGSIVSMPTQGIQKLMASGALWVQPKHELEAEAGVEEVGDGRDEQPRVQ